MALIIAIWLAVQASAQDSAAVGDQVSVHLAAAKQAETASDYLAAAREYQAILALRPGWALIRQSLGVTLHLAGRYEQAIEQLREATRLDDQLWGAYLFLGMDYYQIGKFDSAIEALQRSEARNPGMPETQRWLGLAHGAVGRYEESIGHLRAVLDANERDTEALYSLAKSYDNRASQLFELIGRSEPDSPFVFLLQAERFAAEGDLDRARVEYGRALQARPDLAGTLKAVREAPSAPAEAPEPDSSAFADLRKRFDAGRYRESAELARATLAARPESLEAMYWLGRSCKGLAAATLDRLVAVAPQSHRVDQLKAEMHMDRTEFGKAVDAYLRALEKRPQLPGLRYALGLACSSMGRLEEARQWYAKELDSNPHHALARHGLGRILLDQGKAAEAMPHLRQAVDVDPESAAWRLDLGQAYLESRDYESALSELRVYAESYPESDRVHFLLATAYRHLGRMEDVQRELKLYRELSQERLRRVQQDVRSVAEDIRKARE